MTAAEARKLVVWPYGTSERILAALEEREALLAEIEALRKRAEIGGWVERIREHPMVEGAALTIRTKSAKYGGDASLLFDSSLTKALSRLDSLLPKEPEVVTGESGRQYRRTGGKAIEARHICADGSPTYWATVGGVPVIDAPVVAKLMAKGGKDGE